MPLLAGGSRVAIRSVEADAAGGLIAKGSADPNATVRLFLNQAALTDAKTQSDGRWSLTIKHGMNPGGYVMHADVINPGDATVVASANTPFVYPAAPVPAPPIAPTAASASAEQSSAPLASPADPVIESSPNETCRHRSYVVGAQQKLLRRPDALPGDLRRQPGQIHNPNLIFPGQVFVVPKSDTKP